MASAPGSCQVVTYYPATPGWSVANFGGVTGPPSYFTPSAASAALIRSGHKFRLYNGGVLKEPTVFTVLGVSGPAFGFANVIFGPAPAATPVSGDVATSYPFPVLADPRWLGSLGHVTKLKYSYACPGGCDQMSCVLQKPAQFRTDALNPSRMVQVIKGASVVWDGQLDEPTPAGDGWQITAHGSGTFGGQFNAYYSGAWAGGSSFDSALNNAINRGLRWVNPGIAGVSGLFTGQAFDSGSQSITDMLNLGTSKGGLTWYVTVKPSGNYLSVLAPPTTPNRILVVTSPVSRSIGGDVNTLHIRYQSSKDTATAATYGVTTATDANSIAAHGPLESYLDISSAGQQTAASAQAVGNAILQRYQRASFANSFTVGPGQLMTMGGQPVDLGTEQAASVCKPILADYAYGGEVTPAPYSFLTGKYEYDDDSGTASITPFQAIQTNLGGLLAAAASATKADTGRGWFMPPIVSH